MADKESKMHQFDYPIEQNEDSSMGETPERSDGPPLTPVLVSASSLTDG